MLKTGVQFPFLLAIMLATNSLAIANETTSGGAEFFERRIRPILVEHCYECHSEDASEKQGGLLLDRQSGCLAGGNTNAAVVPGEPGASLLFTAVRYDNADLQMHQTVRSTQRPFNCSNSGFSVAPQGPRMTWVKPPFRDLVIKDISSNKPLHIGPSNPSRQLPCHRPRTLPGTRIQSIDLCSLAFPKTGCHRLRLLIRVY
jgi:hypothetical protein